MTGRRRAASCAWAPSSIPQPQNTMPAAPAPLRKLLRVVISLLPRELILQKPALPTVLGYDCSPAAPFDQAAFGLGEGIHSHRSGSVDSGLACASLRGTEMTS